MTETEDLIAAADSVRRGVTRVARQLRRLRADHGISAAKLSALGRLYRAAAPMTAVDLARGEGLQPQSLTRIIAELDERGLIARTPDESDRRQVLIEITEQGRALLIEDAQQQTAWLARAMVERCTPAERAMVRVAMSLLGRLADG